MVVAELFDVVLARFLVECEHTYQYRTTNEMSLDQIFSDTINSMIADGDYDALNNDNIVEQIYHYVVSKEAFDDFIEDKEEEERESLAFARDPYSFLGLSWNEFIE